MSQDYDLSVSVQFLSDIKQIRELEAKLAESIDTAIQGFEISSNSTIAAQVLLCSKVLELYDKYSSKLSGTPEGIYLNALAEHYGSMAPQLRNEQKIRSLFAKSLDDVSLTARTYNALLHAGFKSIGDIAPKSKAELLEIKNVGKIAVREVEDLLRRMDLELGKDINKYSH